MILWKMSEEIWWSYLAHFYTNCLQQYPDLFTNSTQLYFCSENAMIVAGVDSQRYRAEYNSSFLGNRKEVSDNTYLLEERQCYLREQIEQHPTCLLNKKPIALSAHAVQEKICKLQGGKGSGVCGGSSQLSTVQVLIILSIMFVVFVGVAALYRLYIYFRMRGEIKGEVDKTLEQYYRYIDTFQEGGRGERGESGEREQGRKKARQLTDELEEMEEKRDIEVELTEVPPRQ